MHEGPGLDGCHCYGHDVHVTINSGCVMVWAIRGSVLLLLFCDSSLGVLVMWAIFHSMSLEVDHN
jgi:hypothetical protein